MFDHDNEVKQVPPAITDNDVLTTVTNCQKFFSSTTFSPSELCVCLTATCDIMAAHLCDPPLRPSDLWVASVLLCLFLCLQTPANFRPYVVGVRRRGGSGLGVFGWAAAVIGKYISFQHAYSFLLCFCCWTFLSCSAK